MLAYMYPVSYFICLFGLIFWFYFKEDKKLTKIIRMIFFLGLGLYLLSLAFSGGPLPFKIMILFRDMIVLGLVTQFFRFFRENKFMFFIMLAILFGSYQFKGKSILKQTFSEENIEAFNAKHDLGEASSSTEQKLDPDIQLDKNWELLIEVKNNHQISELQSLLDKYQLNVEPAFQMLNTDQTELDDYFAVNIPDGLENKLFEIEESFVKSGLTDWVEQNEVFNIPEVKKELPIPNPIEYGINDPEVRQLWGFEEMEINKLYQLLSKNKVQAKKKAKIFILDTGVDANHEDLKSNYKSIRSKYDKDEHSHGTHCAGIAASVTNNGKGIASFSPSGDFVQVTSIKVLGAFGGTQRTVINGMLEAADSGADVISMSLGSKSSKLKQEAFAKAVRYTSKAGAIVVVAAGNSKMNARDYAPANTPGVITVSAVDTLLNRASFSNYVTDLKMGIAAPGVKIYSTIPGNKYAAFNGTSMATPYVAGLVGLMRSIDPTLRTKEVYKILNQTGKPTRNVKQTGKMIFPAEAVKAILE